MKNKQYSSKQKPLLIYIHIPKAGGTTLTDIIYRQYSDNILYDVDRYGLNQQSVLLLKEKLTTADTLCGHLLFGVHHHISRPCTYITMLRNPVEQVLSWFYFAHKNLDQYKELFFEGTIDDYINNPAFDYYTINFQSRFITGSDVADLEIAKETIANYFSVVGITELFDESLYIMKKEFGWENVKYQKLNVNAQRARREEIPQTVIDKIVEKNKIDLQLYNYAKEMLEKKIASLDAASIRELSAFQTND
ncbi:sulfotransferase family 2 domain-containing protein [Bacillus albus]|uniref:sulfotransferase family 2 domain-containing protein n=1 Tax=Bacillus albus TaxID=2026189 RepID=UPI00234991E3|nr:sulfotransferase family 2 domain-containing protein [Bacillus albus]MDC6157429.1 sulfotransferase family 2 domain-containing protein [Bacillus albus]MDD8006906.1 sulfotransferase family 2 domain-containing protein [Bacillus albus]